MNSGGGLTPGLKDVDGVKIRFLAYNCTGPIGSWAQSDKPGCNYIHSVTAFEYRAHVGRYPARYAFPMEEDIRAMNRRWPPEEKRSDVLSGEPS
jgi:poly-gamma-glutamate synthesis protein (capsule biosynthesis protein)